MSTTFYVGMSILGLLFLGAIAVGIYFLVTSTTGATPTVSVGAGADAEKAVVPGIAATFQSSTLTEGASEDRWGPTRSRVSARVLHKEAEQSVNKYIVPTNITGKVAAAIFPIEPDMEYVPESFNEGHAPPDQQEFELPPTPPAPAGPTGPTSSTDPNPPPANKADDGKDKKGGLEIIGTYRPDMDASEVVYHDFNMRDGTQVSEGQDIVLPEGIKGGPSRMLILLFGYIDVAFTAWGKDYEVRLAMADTTATNTDGSEMALIRGDKLLKQEGVWKWFDTTSNTFTTTRPEKAQCVPGIRDFVQMHTSNTTFFPLHVLLKEQVDFTDIDSVEGMAVDLDFDLGKFIVIVGEAERTTALEDTQLLALTSITQADFEFNHGGRDVHGNGRPPPLDEIPFDHHNMPVDDQGLPVPFGSFQIDAAGTFVHPAGFAPPFVPGEQDQVYPGAIKEATTSVTTVVGSSRKSRLFNNESGDSEFIPFIEHLDGWDPANGPPPVPDDLGDYWQPPPPGQFFQHNGFYDNGWAKPPPPPPFMPPPEHFAWKDEGNTQYAQLGVMPDGSIMGPPPPQPPPVPPSAGCGCGPNPFKDMAGIFAHATLRFAE